MIDREHTNPATRGVQSVHRAFGLLEALAAGGGEMSIGEIASACELPLPTIHRLLRTLIVGDYVRQLPSRRYALGFRLVPLGIAANAMVGEFARPILKHLVDQLGETANLAVLTGEHAEYIAQAPSRHAMRMFTEVGRRVELHCTGVGKALLAELDDQHVLEIVRSAGMPRYTASTITTESALHAALGRVRAAGYAVDEQEQEPGVRCVAVAVKADGLRTHMALSISGPVVRMTDDVLERAASSLSVAANRIAGQGS